MSDLVFWLKDYEFELTNDEFVSLNVIMNSLFNVCLNRFLYFDFCLNVLWISLFDSGLINLKLRQKNIFIKRYFV